MQNSFQGGISYQLLDSTNSECKNVDGNTKYVIFVASVVKSLFFGGGQHGRTELVNCPDVILNTTIHEDAKTLSAAIYSIT